MSRVLVIDDEKAIRKLLEIALTRSGFHVDMAADGQEGISKFSSNVYDLVITDVLMPDMDGYQVVNYIRKSSRKEVPIIGLSGTPWHLAKGNFDSVLDKPFALKTLIESANDLTEAG